MSLLWRWILRSSDVKACRFDKQMPVFRRHVLSLVSRQKIVSCDAENVVHILCGRKRKDRLWAKLVLWFPYFLPAIFLVYLFMWNCFLFFLFLWFHIFPLAKRRLPLFRSHPRALSLIHITHIVFFNFAFSTAAVVS